jgi:hypothetical protein
MRDEGHPEHAEDEEPEAPSIPQAPPPSGHPYRPAGGDDARIEDEPLPATMPTTPEGDPAPPAAS